MLPIFPKTVNDDALQISYHPQYHSVLVHSISKRLLHRYRWYRHPNSLDFLLDLCSI